MNASTNYRSKFRQLFSKRRRKLTIFICLLMLLLLEFVCSPGLYLSDKVAMWICKDRCRPDSCQGCVQHNFTYLIQNASICQTGPDGSIDLIIVIASEHRQRSRRDVVRETWLSKSKHNSANVRYAFLLSSNEDINLMEMVYKESKLHGDILMEDFKDSYLNLTHKTIMGVKWAATFCRNAKFFMKTDQDMWVNVPRILEVLAARYEELQHSVGGLCFNTLPFRLPYSKWYTSFASYPHIAYPKYCSGAGYITSMNVIEEVNRIYPNVPFFLWEDVYLALCLQQLKIGVTNISGFYRHLVALEPCKMQSEVLTSHEVPSDLMYDYTNAKCSNVV